MPRTKKAQNMALTTGKFKEAPKTFITLYCPVRPAFAWESQFYQEFNQGDLKYLLTINPHKYKQCKLKIVRHDLAYAIPLDDPKVVITITGHDNVGRSFPDDEVCVEILSEEPQEKQDDLPTGKVIGLMRRSEQCCIFICRMEAPNQKLVTPVTQNMTRIRIIQKMPNKIYVRKTEESSHLSHREEYADIAEDQLLVVKVLKWEKGCKDPLGVVTKVVSQQEYMNEKYKIEFSKKGSPPPATVNESSNEEDMKREDLRKLLTFTIDSEKAEDLDDAISVSDMGERYMIAVHITDVASHIRKGSDEDVHARQKGKTFYPPMGVKVRPAFMFSRDLSSDCLSLLPGKERKAISLKAVINKANNEIESTKLSLSRVRSNKRFSYEEADRIIQKHLDREAPLHFSSVEDCVAMAYRFTEAHRRCRLQGSWSSRQRKGESRSHCMVEELMIFYNSAVAEELISSELTQDLTPLRCHQAPDKEQLEQFKRKYSALLPFSAYLSHICGAEQRQGGDEEEIGTEPEQVTAMNVLRPVFERMEALARKSNHSLLQLIISDHIHPTLRPMAIEFEEIQRKAEILRSCSTPSSRLGHHGLQLNAYTFASSPMRRYIDLILQRLLHTVLSDNRDDDHPLYDSGLKEVDSDDDDDDLPEESLIHNITSSSRDVSELVVVEGISPKEHEFKISLLLDRVSGLPIMYSNLKLAEQPEHDRSEKSVTLRWKRRVYSFSDVYKPQPPSQGNVVPIPVRTWREIISAVKVEDWDTVRKCLFQVSREFQVKDDVRKQVHDEREAANKKPKTLESGEVYSSELQHFKELEMNIKLGEVLEVQLGTYVKKGATLTINLLNINPSFEVCLEHARNPIKCFATDVFQSTKVTYLDTKEYRQIWMNLCQLDTAYDVLEENNSVILEDVSIEWEEPKGVFQITETQRKQWLLEFDLTDCFLCIRLRNQHDCTKVLSGSDLPDLQSSLPFTWVAHGIPIKLDNRKKKKKKNKVTEVHFQIKHQNMPYRPPKKSKFTVELIPKKIPSLLQERAVANIEKANDLVKSIAIGTPHNAIRGEPERLPPVDPSLELQTLNASQIKAVQEALRNSFTVIQGPPGTGKTVVGVHLLYQFFMKNKALGDKQQPENLVQGASTNQTIPKKCGILYCGPSNKAVDIVAEKLLKRRTVFKPLRIHSDQMEMQEFPYPGSELNLSNTSLRLGKPKQELRDMTMMYLVRRPENPYSTEIKRLETMKSVEEFDLESYRKVLNEARKHELLKHDVVLCTCSSSQKWILKKTMDFRQIIIDECAMAKEPETFIPLVAHNPQQIVLLGDHKQLQPIVRCCRAKELGLKTSLFERYMKQAVMLDTQYRMHESICQFPSKQFYEGKLKTAVNPGPCYLLNKNKGATAILFGHVEGEEVRLAVSTAAGNEKSVANKLEAKQAVRVAGLLIKVSRVKPQDIAILTPYNAQVGEIKKDLMEKKRHCNGIEDVCVCTIMKSQGSEWPYVIVSTVRSCPLEEIQAEPYPGTAWLRNKLGFTTDPNQVNVAITRAKNGLCILGNSYLLNRNHLWKRLLSHYQEQNGVVIPAQNIEVTC